MNSPLSWKACQKLLTKLRCCGHISEGQRIKLSHTHSTEALSHTVFWEVVGKLNGIALKSWQVNSGSEWDLVSGHTSKQKIRETPGKYCDMGN